MLLLITILITLALQGDSDILNQRDSVRTNHINMEDSSAVNIETNTEIISDNYTAEQLKKDTSITESKTWMIEKETILGY